MITYFPKQGAMLLSGCCLFFRVLSCFVLICLRNIILYNCSMNFQLAASQYPYTQMSSMLLCNQTTLSAVNIWEHIRECFSHTKQSNNKNTMQSVPLHQLDKAKARILFLARSKIRLCSANHRAGYFSNLTCDWLSVLWAYSEQETKNGPRCVSPFLTNVF